MARILIIDDDMMVARLLDDYLSNEGFQISKVTMAEEGFESATKSPPDLIILDVNLPDATGFQICGRFREQEITRDIPIIMVTGAARFPNQQAIGKSLGANEYVLKPFNVVEVGEKIRRLLAGRPPAPAVETVTEKTVVPAETPEEPAGQITPDATPEPLSDLRLQRLGDIRQAEPSIPDEAPPVQTEPETEPVSQNGHSHGPAEIARDVIMPPWEPLTPRPGDSAPKPTPAPMAQEAEPEFVAAPAQDPAPKRAPEKTPGRLPPWPLAGILFTLQLIFAVVTLWLKPERGIDPLLGAGSSAAGWALLLGLLTAAAAALQIPLTALGAIEIIGLASIPIVLKTALTLLGTAIPSLTALSAIPLASQLPALAFWLHPIDIFETAAMILLGIGLCLRTRASILRCASAAAIIALAWALMSRGYFRPL